MRVGIRVDASPLIGGGHVMRCLTLADSLARQGARVTFVTASLPHELQRRIVEAGYEVRTIAAADGLERRGKHWHEPCLDAQAQRLDAERTGAAIGPVDWLIVDHYLLDRTSHSVARSFASRLLVIDDLANRQYDCDLLVDQTFGRDASDYAALLPQAARVLAGSSYALLRPEFAVERRAALDRRKTTAPVGRILVSLGMTDPSGSTAEVLDEVLAAASQRHIDVVLGPSAPSLGHVSTLAQQNPRIELHVDSRNVARLMRDADLAIGAAGTSSLERCCMGLPTVALIVAENQRTSAMALSSAGAAIAVDQPGEVGPALQPILDGRDRLSRMSAAAFAIADGGGAERLLAAMAGEQKPVGGTVSLRPATLDDAELLWLWRNDPTTRAMSRDTNPIAWEAHMRWLTRALEDRSRTILVGERGGAPVGNIGFLEANGRAEVAIVVAPAERSSGVARAMLSAACPSNADRDIHAAVRTANQSSRRLFESCGFQPVESGEPGFAGYLLRAEAGRRKRA